MKNKTFAGIGGKLNFAAKKLLGAQQIEKIKKWNLFTTAVLDEVAAYILRRVRWYCWDDVTGYSYDFGAAHGGIGSSELSGFPKRYAPLSIMGMCWIRMKHHPVEVISSTSISTIWTAISLMHPHACLRGDWRSIWPRANNHLVRVTEECEGLIGLAARQTGRGHLGDIAQMRSIPAHRQTATLFMLTFGDIPAVMRNQTEFTKIHLSAMSQGSEMLLSVPGMMSYWADDDQRRQPGLLRRWWICRLDDLHHWYDVHLHRSNIYILVKEDGIEILLK